MIKSIGILGGGIMGIGLARHFLTKGFKVNIVEADQLLAEKSRAKLEKIFRAETEKGKLGKDQVLKILATFVAGDSVEGLKDADLIIEAVPEDLELKRILLSRLETHVAHNTVICSNTSAIPISAIGASLSSPKRFLGTHFFNPAHLMPLVEVVPGLETSPMSVEKICEFLTLSGKRPIRIKECPGFLVNRILGAFINESMWLLQEAAGVLELDLCAKRMGLPMGPATLGDMVGWDVIYASNKGLEVYYGKRFEIPMLFRTIYSQKRYGVKTGKGLYDHTKTPPAPAEDLAPASRGLDAKGLDMVILRLRSAILSEGIRCLDEGIAAPSDIDVAMILGAGFPEGPIAWAAKVGLSDLLEQLLQLSESYGSRFWPAPILRTHVLAGYREFHCGRGFSEPRDQRGLVK